MWCSPWLLVLGSTLKWRVVWVNASGMWVGEQCQMAHLTLLICDESSGTCEICSKFFMWTRSGVEWATKLATCTLYVSWSTHTVSLFIELMVSWYFSLSNGNRFVGPHLYVMWDRSQRSNVRLAIYPHCVRYVSQAGGRRHMYLWIWWGNVNSPSSLPLAQQIHAKEKRWYLGFFINPLPEMQECAGDGWTLVCWTSKQVREAKHKETCLTLSYTFSPSLLFQQSRLAGWL